MNMLPAPTVVEEKVKGHRSHEIGDDWPNLAAEVIRECDRNGNLSQAGVRVISAMSRHIQQLEAQRTPENRSDRARLSKESQAIQDLIDETLFCVMGLSTEDIKQLDVRLAQML